VQLYRENKEKGFEIVSVNVADSAQDVAAFFRKYGATHIGALNGTRDDVAKLYGADSTPRNFVINKEGQVIAEIKGGGKGDTRIDKALKKAGLGAE
jgi:hypothetical protein